MYLIANKDLKSLSGNIEDYPEGIVFPIDKPYRWTSADVIRKVKFAAIRHFGKKNLKVGHAGTLDPLATGVLLVCVGNATKKAEEMQRHDKEYVAGISFGATTPSYDLEKEVDRVWPLDGVSEEALEKALDGFLGEQEQVAPLFSAKSVDGVRAYDLARRMMRKAKEEGRDFDHSLAEILSRQQINISELELLSYTPVGDSKSAFVSNSKVMESGVTDENTGKETAASSQNEQRSGNPNLRIHVADTSALLLPKAEIRIACTKGTYVRAFARDLGEALGSGAHLNSLRRTKSGGFSAGKSLSVDEAMSLLSVPEK